MTKQADHGKVLITLVGMLVLVNIHSPCEIHRPNPTESARKAKFTKLHCERNPPANACLFLSVPSIEEDMKCLCLRVLTTALTDDR